MAGTPAMQCLICMDEVTDEARACGFCNKRICRTCLPHLVEINYEGEADEENGDLRCPNCRGSLVEGDLHIRRTAIATVMTNVSTQVVADIVTMEDFLEEILQVPPAYHARATHESRTRQRIRAESRRRCRSLVGRRIRRATALKMATKHHVYWAVLPLLSLPP